MSDAESTTFLTDCTVAYYGGDRFDPARLKDLLHAQKLSLSDRIRAQAFPRNHTCDDPEMLFNKEWKQITLRMLTTCFNEGNAKHFKKEVKDKLDQIKKDKD